MHRLTLAVCLALAGAIVPAGLSAAGETGGAAPAAAPQVPLRFYSNRGGDFSLLDQHAQRLDTRALRGRVLLLTFGYTYCPDICPATLAAMSAARTLLGAAGEATQVLFVSLDAERDSPQRLAEYLANFAGGVVGLTGTRAEIAAVARQFHAKFALRGEAGAATTIDHTAFIYLIDQQGRLRALLPHTAPPQFLAEGVRQLLANAP